MSTLTEIPGVVITQIAQSNVVKHTLIGGNGYPADSGIRAIGVALQDASTGDLLPIAISGVVIVICDNSINAGDKIQASSGNAAVNNNLDLDQAATVCGVALDSGTAGQLIRVKLV